MLNIVNVVLVLFLFIIINHFLSYEENFECNVNLTSKETCFRRTQKQNGLKIKEAKTTQKTVAKILADVKKIAETNEGKIASNRRGVIGLQQNRE